MTTTQLIDRMRDLGLDGMAGAVEHHAASTTYADLPFDDRLMHLLHAEGAWRDERRLKRILKAARLKIPLLSRTSNIDRRAGWIVARSLN